MRIGQLCGAVMVLAALGSAGCFSHSRLPSYDRARFKTIIAAETRPQAPGVVMSEKDVQAEVDRLYALRPARPVPRRVLLYGVESSGETHISSARKRLLLRKETSDAMKSALEETRLFAEVDFLPELYLPTDVQDLKTLRLAAARAQADALLIYSTEAGFEYEPNALCILYPTIIGAFVAPGSKGASLAVSQAVLVDVKTGYIHRVFESYGEKSGIAPVALLDEEALEFEARKQAVQHLAALTASKVHELGRVKE